MTNRRYFNFLLINEAGGEVVATEGISNTT